MGTLVAYSTEAYKYLGFATGGEFEGLYVNLNDTPLVVCEGQMIIGVSNNRLLQQHFTVNKHTPADLSYKSILQSFDFIQGYSDFKKSRMLIITVSGDIFYYDEGLMYDIKAKYFAIGDGREVAMGCMYGIRSTDFSDQEKIEITLKAISYNRPNQAMTTGLERI